MDKEKLMQLIYDQRPEPDEAFDLRIAHQVQRLIREEQPMKKKMSVLAIVVAVILSLALLGAAAELMGINVFELFGKDDARLQQLAPQAVLKEISPLTVTSPELGTTVAGINSAYYDGQSLLVAYAIKNGQHTEAYTPNEEQLAQMEKDTNPPIRAVNDPSDTLTIQWNDAVSAGKPFGYVLYSITPSDHTTTPEGLDLPSSSEDTRPGEDGFAYTIRDYESPLPAEAQNRDMLTIEIGLHQRAQYCWFDGKDAYVRHDYQKLASMTATIWRADAEVRRFAGTMQFAGHPVKVTATASAAHAQAMLVMDNGTFPVLPEDAWYGVYLRDGNQAELRTMNGENGGTSSMTISFEGTGQLPQTLEIQLRVDHEDGVTLDPALAQPAFAILEQVQ